MTPRLASISALRPSCPTARNLMEASPATRSRYGVSRRRLTPAIATMKVKSSTFTRRSWPYNVPTRAGIVPERNQVLTRPVASRVATLAIPSVEKRKVAPRATATPSGPPSRRAAASNRASGKSAPSHAPVASKCKMSAGRWRASHGTSSAAAPCPAQAREATSAALDTSPIQHQACFQMRPCTARQAAITMTSAARNRQSSPNCVLVKTMPTTPCGRMVPSGTPLICDATTKSQTTPLASAISRLVQLSARSRRSSRASSARAAWTWRNAGRAMKHQNTNVPSSAAVAAKCSVRATIKSASIAAHLPPT